MTELYKAKMCRKVALTSWGEVASYHWGPEFSYKQIKEKAKKFLNQHPEYLIDLTKLIRSDCEELDFARWNDESELMLIPIWLHHFCNPIAVVKSITGEKCTLTEADKDHRFGALAFGIIPKIKRG